jgi:hypothetical protein
MFDFLCSLRFRDRICAAVHYRDDTGPATPWGQNVAILWHSVNRRVFASPAARGRRRRFPESGVE